MRPGSPYLRLRIRKYWGTGSDSPAAVERLDPDGRWRVIPGGRCSNWQLALGKLERAAEMLRRLDELEGHKEG